MAFNPAPSAHIASWAEAAGSVSFPLTSVPELTDVEAHATTGDIRKVAYALCSKLYALHAAMATADKPVRFTASRSSSFSGDNINRSFNFTFVTTPTGIEVIDEPA